MSDIELLARTDDDVFARRCHDGFFCFVHTGVEPKISSEFDIASPGRRERYSVFHVRNVLRLEL
jgi:hypothetical protein